MIYYSLHRSQRRSVAIQVLPSGTVRVHAPYLLPKFLIDEFVRRKSPWIEKKIRLFTKYPLQIKSTITDSDLYYYLGQECRIHVGAYTHIAIVKDTIQFPHHLLFRGKKELTNWYINEAKNVISKRVVYFAHRMETTYKKISYSDTTSKWGSCTPDNALQFNWRLVMAPVMVIDYVVVHELAHTKEKNHGKDFWAIVAHEKPAYKQHIKWLKENTNILQGV